MKLFKTLFNLAKLPIIVAKDAVMVVPKIMVLEEPFRDTKRLCEEMDEDISAD